MAHVKQVAHLTKQKNEVGQSLSQGTPSSAWGRRSGLLLQWLGVQTCDSDGCDLQWLLVPRYMPRPRPPPPVTMPECSLCQELLNCGQWSLTSKSPWYR